MRLVAVTIFSLFLLASCGSSQPRLAQPADGQTFTIGGQTPVSFYVTMENDDYNDVSITIKGDLPAGEVACSGGQGTMMICQSSYNMQGQGQNSNCQQSCTAIIVATKGDNRDFRTIRFVRQGVQ